MQLPQTIIAAVFIAIGAVFVVLGSRKQPRTDLRVPLMTPRGKLVLGLLLIFIGVSVFLSQYATGPRPPLGGKMR
jgi:hypothetical protein